MSYAITTEPLPARPAGSRKKQLPLRFLAVALAIHFALLTMPVALRGPAPEPTRSIAIELVPDPASTPLPVPALSVPPAAPAEPIRQPNESATTPRNETATQPEPPRMIVPPVAATTATQQKNDRHSIQVEDILSAVREMDWTEDVPTQRLPGRSMDSDLSEQWLKPVLPSVTTAFTERYAPSAVEIVDQWMAPGGVMHSVIRTPTGDTLCGRQAAVDDMRPWLTMPMMFGSCGGGGKRKSGVD